MQEEIRSFRPDEVGEHIRLSEFAFQYELTEDERSARIQETQPQQLLGAFIDGRLAAKVLILPLQVYWYGAPCPMGGVAAVATWPEYRRHGLVARLLQESLLKMRADGQLVSCLHPFSFAFYRRYGWETYVDRKRIELTKTQLPHFARPSGWRCERIADTSRVRPLYAAFACEANGTLARDGAWWEQRVFRQRKGLLVVAVDEQGRDRGYIHYEVKKETLTIHELVYDSIETYDTLWRHVADHDSMATTYTGFVRADDPLAFLLDDPRIKQEIQPYFMARIIDVEALLARIPFAPPAASGAAPTPGLLGTPERPEAPALALAVTALDPWAPWNEKTFTVAIDPVQGRRIAAHAIAADHIRSLDDVHIQCTIQTLSAMLFGYKRPRLLHALGLITGTQAAVAAWEQALPERVTHLMDFF